MYPLGHLGIALATTRLGGYIGYKAFAAFYPGASGRLRHQEVAERAGSWISRTIDARFLLLGAVLPDIIDKPLGLLLLSPPIARGHVFCHTLLFALLLFVSGVISRGLIRRTLLALAIGVSFHLLLDNSWADPRTLFWPLLGWQFAEGAYVPVSDLPADVASGLLNSPESIWGEIIGGISLLVMFGRLKREGWQRFIKSGEL